MEVPAIERIVASANPLGETPVWCERTQTLFWINCEPDPALFQWNPKTGFVTHWPMPRRIGAVVISENGGLLLALSDGIYGFDPDTAALNLIAAGPHGSSVVLHEGRCDRQGRLWIGSCRRGEPNTAFFYRLDGDRLVPQVSGLSVCNGLAFSPDGRTLYLGDSFANEVWAFQYNIATGEISNRRTFVRLLPDEGMIDGAAVDREGGYWVALFRGSAIRRYRPDGTLDRELRLPISQPTMPAFGGPDFTDMFITSTRHGKDATALVAEPGLGHLYRISGMAVGLPDPLHRARRVTAA